MANELTKNNNDGSTGSLGGSTGSNNVTLTKEQWVEIQNLISKYKSAFGVEKPKRVLERTASVRFHNGKPVVKVDNVRQEMKNGKSTMVFDIYLIDDPKPITVEYLPFLNDSEQVTVKILNQHATEQITSAGEITARNPDPAHIKDWRGDRVELEVKKITYIADVEVENGIYAGLKFQIPTLALNM